MLMNNYNKLILVRFNINSRFPNLRLVSLKLFPNTYMYHGKKMQQEKKMRYPATLLLAHFFFLLHFFSMIHPHVFWKSFKEESFKIRRPRTEIFRFRAQDLFLTAKDLSGKKFWGCQNFILLILDPQRCASFSLRIVELSLEKESCFFFDSNQFCL